jgi:hypothetical protein
MHLVLPTGILDENLRSDKQGNIGCGSQTITGGAWKMKLIHRKPYLGITTYILVMFKRALYLTVGKSPHHPHGFITVGTTIKNNKRRGITVSFWRNYERREK